MKSGEIGLGLGKIARLEVLAELLEFLAEFLGFGLKCAETLGEE